MFLALLIPLLILANAILLPTLHLLLTLLGALPLLLFLFLGALLILVLLSLRSLLPALLALLGLLFPALLSLLRLGFFLVLLLLDVRRRCILRENDRRGVFFRSCLQRRYRSRDSKEKECDVTGIVRHVCPRAEPRAPATFNGAITAR